MGKFEVPTDSKTLIDTLGEVRAKQADLEIQEAKLKNAIVTKLGEGAHEGYTFRVSVSFSERATLPIKVAVAKLKALGATKRWFTGHTKRTPVTTVTCHARTGHNLKIAA